MHAIYLLVKRTLNGIAFKRNLRAFNFCCVTFVPRLFKLDSFGLLPIEAEYLFKITALKHISKLLGIKKITMNSKGGSIIFKENTDISYEKLLDLLNEREIYRMKGPYQVNIKMISNTPEDRFEIIENTLNRLKN